MEIFISEKTREWKNGRDPESGTSALGENFEAEFNRLYGNTRYNKERMDNHEDEIITSENEVHGIRQGSGNGLDADTVDGAHVCNDETLPALKDGDIPSVRAARLFGLNSFEKLSNKCIDPTFASNSDTEYPSVKAAKGYGDNTFEKLINKCIDQTLTSNSDTEYPSVKAAKGYIDNAIAALVGGAPGALDTLNELAAALADDANFSATVTNELTRLDNISPMVGSILAVIHGYFLDAANGSFTAVSITISSNYVLCDGSAPNDPASPIWNTEDRHVPNLTDDRFLMGATSPGVAGGSNDILAKMPEHYHSESLTTVSYSHRHYSGVTVKHAGQTSQGYYTYGAGSAIADMDTSCTELWPYTDYVGGPLSISGSIGDTGGVSGDAHQYLYGYSGANKPEFLTADFYIRIK